jgi:thiol-disulfide isomerase/thioredoxin
MIEIQSLEDYRMMCANNIYLVVDIYGTWCMPCKVVAPQFEELAKKYKGKCSFVKMNVDVMEEGIPLKFPGGLPCFAFIKNGKENDSLRIYGADINEVERNLATFLKG